MATAQIETKVETQSQSFTGCPDPDGFVAACRAADDQTAAKLWDGYRAALRTGDAPGAMRFLRDPSFTFELLSDDIDAALKRGSRSCPKPDLFEVLRSHLEVRNQAARILERIHQTDQRITMAEMAVDAVDKPFRARKIDTPEVVVEMARANLAQHRASVDSLNGHKAARQRDRHELQQLIKENPQLLADCELPSY